MTAMYLECVLAGLGLLLLAAPIGAGRAERRAAPVRVSREDGVGVTHPPRR